MSKIVPMSLSKSETALFHRRILEAAKQFGEDIALTDCETGECLSFIQFRAKSVQLASLLHGQFGIARGDLLLCLWPNCLEYPLILMATALLGAPLSGASPESTREDLDVFITKTGCRAILATGDCGHLDWLWAKANEKDIPLLLLNKSDEHRPMGIDFKQLLEQADMDEAQIEAFLANAPDNGLQLDATFVAPMSSGASGVPKVVLQTHRNYIAATQILKEAVFDELTATGGGRRCTIAAQPFCHASGLWILCYCLLTGHRSLLMQKFKPDVYLGLIEEYKIDTLSLGPWLISVLLKQNLQDYDLSSVRTIISGGSSEATNAEQNGQFLGHFPGVNNFLIGYGMTEIVLISHMTPLHMDPGDERRLRSVGKLLPGFEHKIVDCLSGADLTQLANARGELWLRSECVMAGYRNELALRGSAVIDGDGWFHTGDVLWRDGEGFFFYLDRLANLVLVDGGRQVWPAELESVLLAHPSVLEACVIGVQNDECHGQVPMAFVVLKKEKSKEEEGILLEQIRQFSNVRLEQFQQLRGEIFVVESLPKTPFGKVAKQKVRQMMGQIKEAGKSKEKKGIYVKEEEKGVKECQCQEQEEEGIVTICQPEEAEESGRSHGRSGRGEAEQFEAKNAENEKETSSDGTSSVAKSTKMVKWAEDWKEKEEEEEEEAKEQEGTEEEKHGEAEEEEEAIDTVL